MPFLGPAPAKRGLVVPARRFRLQVALLKAFGFTGITLRQWIDGLDGIAPLPKKAVILTFDDGYAGIYDYVLPILLRAGFRATCYVIAEDLVDGPKEERAFPVVSCKQARELLAAGFEIGSHSLTHMRLGKADHSQKVREIYQSKQILAKALDTRIDTFAYPYGECDMETLACVRNAGYRAAVIVRDSDPAAGENRFALRRIPLGYDQSMAGFIRYLWPYILRHCFSAR
jgi:peptidoglycan/xylan/chitin deacetylase (PgdA/CDA1 family)